MKKLFGGIDLTWKKLILFAVAAGVYTAIMAVLPITKDTSFRDIAIYFEWWILFGIIIIANSKSPVDSALKSFVFFLISQPLVYLVQILLGAADFGIFRYYTYWFIWTIACLPMGYIGYFIKRKDLLSMIILLPMLLLIALMGMGYFTETVNDFPHHLLSLIACALMIIVIVWNLFDKTKLKIITLSIVAAVMIIYIVLRGGIGSRQYETYVSLDNYEIAYAGDIEITYFSGTAKGNVEIITASEEFHTVKVSGKAGEHYYFDITDEENNEYHFEYYFDVEQNTVVLNRID